MLGIVLAGGLSSRLGTDKVILPWQGENLLTKAVRTLQDCNLRVKVSTRASRSLPEGFEYIFDEEENLGPLGALYSILRATSEPCLVIPCDLPFMQPATLQKLMAARTGTKLITTFKQSNTGFIEALVAIYEPASLPFFAAAKAKEIRQLNLVIPQELQDHVIYTPEESLPFLNINYPKDLARAIQILETIQTS